MPKRENMTTQSILDVAKQKRCAACTSKCAMTLHSVSMPQLFLVDIAGVVTPPMESDYVLTFVDIEVTFCDQVYDLDGVGYMVNGNQFVS